MRSLRSAAAILLSTAAMSGVAMALQGRTNPVVPTRLAPVTHTYTGRVYYVNTGTAHHYYFVVSYRLGAGGGGALKAPHF
jgi:hypothetical protein